METINFMHASFLINYCYVMYNLVTELQNLNNY